MPTEPAGQPAGQIAGYVNAAEVYTDLCDVVERAWMHDSVDRGPDEPRGTSGYARKAANRILDLIAPMLAAHDASCEKEVLDVIDERDRYHEVADALADKIADMTGADIGEHSSANDPWSNALTAAADYARRSGDFEYGIRTLPSGTIHREGMTLRQARKFMDPKDLVGPDGVDLGRVFEMVRRRRGPWQAVP